MRARDQARRVGDWAGERVPGADLVVAALERERLAAAGLLAGGLAYRLFFWLVPLGLVFASVLSFWVDEDRVGLQDAARNFGISGAATQSAMKAIAEEHHARWYFLIAGIVLLVWFGIGVIPPSTSPTRSPGASGPRSFAGHCSQVSPSPGSSSR